MVSLAGIPPEGIPCDVTTTCLIIVCFVFNKLKPRAKDSGEGETEVEEGQARFLSACDASVAAPSRYKRYLGWAPAWHVLGHVCVPLRWRTQLRNNRVVAALTSGLEGWGGRAGEGEADGCLINQQVSMM